MHIPLPHDVEELIARRVDAGEYETPSDLLIHTVHLLNSHDRLRHLQLEDLLRGIAIGIGQCDRGETEPFTAARVGRIAVEGRKRLAEEAERLRAEADDWPRTPGSRSMKQPRLTDRAEPDLEERWLNIARDDARRATRFIETIPEQMRVLGRAAGQRALRTGLAPDLRSLAVGRYVILYGRIDLWRDARGGAGHGGRGLPREPADG